MKHKRLSFFHKIRSVSLKNVLRLKKTTPRVDYHLSKGERVRPIEEDRWSCLHITCIENIFSHAKSSSTIEEFRRFLSTASLLNHHWKDATDNLVTKLDLKKIWDKPLEQLLLRFNQARNLRLTSVDAETFQILPNHVQLRELEIYAVDFQSPRMIRALSRISFIQKIVFRKTPSIDDRVARALVHCTGLTSLDLTGCSLITEQGAKSIGKITTLEHLYLADALSIPTEGLLSLSSLTKLKTLNLSGVNTVGNSILHSLTAMTDLTDLDVFMCPKVTDVGLWYLARKISLRSLNVFSCDKITDEGLRAIAQHSRLETLNLGWCCLISDIGIQYLSKLTTLRELRLCCVSITIHGLNYLSNLTNLTLLDLRGCDISPMKLSAGIKKLRELSGGKLTILRT